jgi:anti-sigma regulatory factor (Ser/Thr protein kinase)
MAGGFAPQFSEADVVLDLVLPPDWAALSVVRDRVSAWLRAHRWPSAHLDDLVLAVNEAVTNSLEHGYGLRPGAASSAASLGSSALIEVHGEIIIDRHGRQCAEVTVRDHGRWRTPSDEEPARGDGIRLMRACTDEVTVLRGAGGSVVHLRSRPLPTLPCEPG